MSVGHDRDARARSLALAAPLSAEDCSAQSMPDASALKWHLAHSTWFVGTFILEWCEEDFAPFHPACRMLFKSHHHGVGERHRRRARRSCRNVFPAPTRWQFSGLRLAR